MPTREIVPTAPTHARVVAAGLQVQQASSIKENYYRASSWRSAYEWRQEDAKEEREERAGLRAPRGSTPPVRYSWQDTATAKAYLSAAEQHERKMTRIRAGEEAHAAVAGVVYEAPFPSNRHSGDPGLAYSTDLAKPLSHSQQHPQHSASPPPRPLNPLALSPSDTHGAAADSLDSFAHPATAGQLQQNFRSASPFAGRHSISPGRSRAEQRWDGASDLALHAYSSAPAPRTGRSTLRSSRPALPTTLAGIPVRTDALAASSLSSRIGGSSTARKPTEANWQLRGAGALPTHRHTTRASQARSSVDWTDWANQVEARLAEAEGSLSTRKPAGATWSARKF